MGNPLKGTFIMTMLLLAPYAYAQNPEVHGLLQSERNGLADILLGTWVTAESLITPQIESPENSSFFKYEFTPNRVGYYGSNEYERGVKFAYFMLGNSIEMFGNSYSIQEYDHGQLELLVNSSLVNVEPYTIKLIRKDIYDSLWRFRQSYGALSKSSSPIFTGKVHLYNYLYSNFNDVEKAEEDLSILYYRAPAAPPKNDRYIKVRSVIDSAGNFTVSEVIAIPNISKNRQQQIKRKLENTSGYWLPAIENGKRITSNFDFKFLQRGKSSLKIVDSSILYFRKAYDAYSKDDYYSAVQLISSAISLNTEKFQFYILRAACHIKMNKVDKYCDDVMNAHNLNPFVSLTHAEELDGELIEINCAEN